jgi:hypothetical protein
VESLGFKLNQCDADRFTLDAQNGDETWPKNYEGTLLWLENSPDGPAPMRRGLA